MKDYKQRIVDSMSQDPDKCLESPMEKEVYELFRDRKLLPEMQFKVDKYFIDFAFPDIKVGVEYDGAHHNTLKHTNDDLERDIKLAEFGWSTLRIYRVDNSFRLLYVWDEVSTTKYLKHTMDIVASLINEWSEIEF